MTDETTKADNLETALALIYDAISLNNKGLRANPDKEQRRDLLLRRTRLEAERAHVESMLDAMADGKAIDVEPPTEAQMKTIAKLTGDVARQTQTAITAEAVLTTTGEVLDLAMALKGGA
jgi:hypothetical protein